MAWTKSSRSRGMTKSGWAQQRDAARILTRDHHRCYVPGCTARATVVDHVVPLAEGGADEDTNKAAMCEPHHAAKTQAEAARARARRPGRRRPPEPHPGLR